MEEAMLTAVSYILAGTRAHKVVECAVTSRTKD